MFSFRGPLCWAHHADKIFELWWGIHQQFRSNVVVSKESHHQHSKHLLVLNAWYHSRMRGRRYQCTTTGYYLNISHSAKIRIQHTSFLFTLDQGEQCLLWKRDERETFLIADLFFIRNTSDTKDLLHLLCQRYTSSWIKFIINVFSFDMDCRSHRARLEEDFFLQLNTVPSTSCAPSRVRMIWRKHRFEGVVDVPSSINACCSCLQVPTITLPCSIDGQLEQRLDFQVHPPQAAAISSEYISNAEFLGASRMVFWSIWSHTLTSVIAFSHRVV